MVRLEAAALELAVAAFLQMTVKDKEGRKAREEGDLSTSSLEMRRASKVKGFLLSFSILFACFIVVVFIPLFFIEPAIVAMPFLVLVCLIIWFFLIKWIPKK